MMTVFETNPFLKTLKLIQKAITGSIYWNATPAKKYRVKRKKKNTIPIYEVNSKNIVYCIVFYKFTCALNVFL